MSDLGVEPEVIEVETGAVSAASSENKGAQVGKAKTTTKIIDHPAVLDADGTVKSLVEAADPQLNGTYDFNGVSCSTAYDLLLEDIMEYAPEKAQEICDVPAETIVELAHLALDGPCTHRLGWGLQLLHQRRARGPRQHHHGSAHGPDRLSGRRHGCWRLQGMLGHQRGCEGHDGGEVPYDLGACAAGDHAHRQVEGRGLPRFARSTCTLATPVSNQVNTNEYINDVVGNMDLYVVADYTFTDTVKYADIVLPASHWFEQQELVPISATQCFLHSEKAIDPLYESKSDFEILKLLAEGMGYPDLIDLTEDEYMSQVVDTPALGALGITYDAIKQNEDMYWYPEKPWIPLEERRVSHRIRSHGVLCRESDRAVRRGPGVRRGSRASAPLL